MDGLSIRTWLGRCLSRDDIALRSWRDVRHGKSGCRVWECDIHGESLLLKLYSPGFDDCSRLGPADTARKHALALSELPRFGVPTPWCVGFGAEGDEAALVMERLAGLPFSPEHRIEAARILARLHMIQLAELSPELATLIRRSTPNRGRVGGAPNEPPLTETTVQHGDFFSANIIATRDGLRVLDWDLLALGDPMWDLGFLLCADRGVTEQDAEAIIAAYQEVRPAATERLAWQRRCWQLFWDGRDRCKGQR